MHPPSRFTLHDWCSLLTHLDHKEHVVGLPGTQAIDDVCASFARPYGKRAVSCHGVFEDVVIQRCINQGFSGNSGRWYFGRRGDRNEMGFSHTYFALFEIGVPCHTKVVRGFAADNMDVAVGGAIAAHSCFDYRRVMQLLAGIHRSA